MRCPDCDCPRTFVRDSRVRDEADMEVRRRRQCKGCGLRFNTYEISDARHTDLTEAQHMLDRVRAILAAR